VTLTPGSIPSSPPYRAVLFRGSEIVWECSCPGHRSRVEAWVCADEVRVDREKSGEQETLW
jgi:hypothetical protein